MTDIATLGLAVDSTQVSKASTELNKLAAAAKPAAAGASNLENATKRAAEAHRVCPRRQWLRGTQSAAWRK